MDLASLKIVVGGAATGGAATALLLARAGARVTVLERVESPRAVGAGIGLADNGLAVLESLGLGAALATVARPVGAPRIVDGAGRTIFAPPGPPPRVWMVRRGDLQSLLLDALSAEPRIELRCGAEVVRAAPDGRVGVRAAGRELRARRRPRGRSRRRRLPRPRWGAFRRAPRCARNSLPARPGFFSPRAGRGGVDRGRALRELRGRGRRLRLRLRRFATHARRHRGARPRSARAPPGRRPIRRRYPCSPASSASKISSSIRCSGSTARAGTTAGSCWWATPRTRWRRISARAPTARWSMPPCCSTSCAAARPSTAGLAAYEARRRPAVRRVAAAAARLGALAEWTHPLARRVRDRGLMPLASRLARPSDLARLLQEPSETLLAIGRA